MGWGENSGSLEPGPSTVSEFHTIMKIIKVRLKGLAFFVDSGMVL